MTRRHHNWRNLARNAEARAARERDEARLSPVAAREPTPPSSQPIHGPTLERCIATVTALPNVYRCFTQVERDSWIYASRPENGAQREDDMVLIDDAAAALEALRAEAR